MEFIRWQGKEKPEEEVLRAQMRRQGLSPYTWSNGPGDRYSAHSHSYEKVLYCVSGSIRFILPQEKDEQGHERFVDLEPGDCMVLPAGVVHSAVVGAKGVTCLEAQRR